MRCCTSCYAGLPAHGACYVCPLQPPTPLPPRRGRHMHTLNTTHPPPPTLQVKNRVNNRVTQPWNDRTVFVSM